MVTYCVGSARQKRAYFMNGGFVLLDNVEVLFCASENGYNYFAYGTPPFSAFYVREYLDYMRALCPQKVSDKDILRFGLRPDEPLRNLSPVKRRALAYLESTGGKRDDGFAPVINLDGTRFCMRYNRELRKLIREIGDCYVCVSDIRFVRHARGAYKILSFGKKLRACRPRFFAARRLAKELNAKKIAVF